MPAPRSLAWSLCMARCSAPPTCAGSVSSSGGDLEASVERGERRAHAPRLVQRAERLEHRRRPLEQPSGAPRVARGAAQAGLGDDRLGHLVTGADLLENRLRDLQMLRGRLGLNSGEGLAEDALRYAFEIARPTFTARRERLVDDLAGPRAVAGREISLG